MSIFFENALQKSIRLIKIPSVTTAGTRDGAPLGENVRKCLDIALDAAKELGFKTVDLDGYCGYAEIGEGEPFGVLGHLDVVPPGENWTKEQGVIEDGVLYGRGAVDDKTPIMLCLFATAELMSRGMTPKRNIRIVFGCDEESGKWSCMQKYNECCGVLSDGFSPDADFPVIYAEKGILDARIEFSANSDKAFEIIGGARINMVPDSCRLKIDGIEQKFDGRSAHGSQPQKGDNAVLKALKALSGYSENVRIVAEKLSDCTGKKAGINFFDADSGALTLNPGLISSDGDRIAISVDIRYPVSFSFETVMSALSAALPFAECSVINVQPPLKVDKNGASVLKLLDAYNSVTGENAEPISIGGGTYARAMNGGVAFGPEFPGEDNRIHQADECVTIASLKKAYDIYLKALEKTCF